MSLEKTERIIREYSKNLTYKAISPEIIPIEGVASWDVTHNLSTTNVVAGLFDMEDTEVEKVMQVLTPNKIRIIWPSDAEVLYAGTFAAFIVSGGATNGLTIDSELSVSSMNAVQNAVITEVLPKIEETLHNLNSGTGEA